MVVRSVVVCSCHIPEHMPASCLAVSAGTSGMFSTVKSDVTLSLRINFCVCSPAETPSLVHPLEDHVVSVGETVALQCKATGSPPPRITWLKGDQPLVVTERHHFTSGNQLLIVRNVVLEDAGKYTCEMSNTLGTERAHSHVSILQSLGCRKDRTTVGIITIAVVCSIVLTSLVWVCIIYQTRKKSEEYSVTNTGSSSVLRPPLTFHAARCPTEAEPAHQGATQSTELQLAYLPGSLGSQSWNQLSFAVEACSELHFSPWLALQEGLFHLAVVAAIALLLRFSMTIHDNS